MLNDGGLATLLFDLLTAEEHEIDQYTREFRFDIDMLSERMIATIDWLGNEAAVKDLSIGLFGASTGAAAALNAAAGRPDRIAAVVSRGGRPDLAMQSLPQVRSPKRTGAGQRAAHSLSSILLYARICRRISCKSYKRIKPYSGFRVAATTCWMHQGCSCCPV